MIKNNYCIDCKTLIWHDSTRCIKCSILFKNLNKIIREYFCIDCGKRISVCNHLYGKNRCQICSRKYTKPTRIGAVLSKETKNKISNSLKGRFKGEKSPAYKDGRYSKSYYCKDCGKEVHMYTALQRGRYGRCTKCCKAGKLNPNYKNGESGSRFKYPSCFNDYLKNKIRKRDRYKCQFCGLKEAKCFLKNKKVKLCVHHIDYNKDNCNENNLICLCHKCHSISNGNRDYWYAYYTYIMEINLG